VERLTDGKYLAAKIIRGNTSNAALSRFAREAEIASTLNHPNVVSVLDIDVTSAGELFLVMELVKGTTLEEARSKYGDVKWGVTILLQIAKALEAIHKHGVVHRDLKPSNVLVTGDVKPVVKIADFGISSLRSETPEIALPPAPMPQIKLDPAMLGETIEAPTNKNAELTREGVILGTPLYMAPELLEGSKEAKTSADIFSFGIMAYELLTGKLPFEQPPVVQRLQGRTLQSPEPIVSVCTALDPAVGRVIDQCLRIDASGRPQAAEVLSALSMSA
jgi:serine/threonine protein kinase